MMAAMMVVDLVDVMVVLWPVRRKAVINMNKDGFGRKTGRTLGYIITRWLCRWLNARLGAGLL